MNPLREPPIYVLIVEDDAILLLNLADWFRSEGFVVVEAASGEAALDEVANGNRFDAVVTDIQLGDSVNGWDVPEVCRSRWPEISVLYASGHTSGVPRPVENSRYFGKPYDPAEISDACRKLCAN